MMSPRRSAACRVASRDRRRPGLSLLEVVVALAILLFSVVAIGQLISIGSDRALDVQIQAQGSMLCQRKLAEVMVGAEPLATAGYASFPDGEDLSDWQWKLDANPGTANGIWNVQVAVKYEGANNRTIEIQMGQMILDPAIRGSSQDAPPASVAAANGSAALPNSGTPSSGSTAP